MFWWWIACTPGEDAPVVEARGGGGGYWPPHSVTALVGAMDLAFDGIETDVVMTQDGVPLLWAQDTLADGCNIDEQPLPDTVQISETVFDDLAGIQCGGNPNPDFPNALVGFEPLLRLDVFLGLLRDLAPTDQRVHLNLQPSSGDPEEQARFALEVMERWRIADPPQPLVVSTTDAALLSAIEVDARRTTTEVLTVLRQHVEDERDPAPASDTLLEQAESVRADGIGIDHRRVSRGWLRRAQRRGLGVVVYTVNEPKRLERLARWPLLGILTDYPGDVGPTTADERVESAGGGPR